VGIINALEQRAAQSWPPGPTDDFWFRSTPHLTGSGATVNADTATSLTAVWRAVSLLSDTMGMLPAKVYRRRADGSKEPLPNNPVSKLLRWQPNKWQTAFTWYEMMGANIELRGNAFSRVERDGIGRPTALIPWDPDRVMIKVSGDRVTYTLTRRDGTTASVGMEDMLHVRGPGEGLIGYSPIARMAESLGVGFAAQSYGARFFGNDSRPGGVLKMPGTLSKDARDNIEKGWRQAHTGGNQHSVAVLEEGLEFQAIGIAPEEAQFLETRNFQIDEVGRMFGVPPHMLMQNNRSTFNNVEHQGQEFATYSMQPRLVRWEQEIKRTLFPGEEDVFVEFLMDAMLRADTKSRAEANSIRFMNGNLSANEWRRMENQNPTDTEGGDMYWVPLNLGPMDQAAEGVPELPTDEPPPDDDDEDRSGWRDLTYLTDHGVENRRAMEMGDEELRSAASRHRQARSFQRLFQSVTQRVVRRDVTQVRRLVTASDSQANLTERIGAHYDDYAKVVSKELHPALRTYAEVIFGIAVREVGSTQEWGAEEDVFMQQYADNSGTRYAISSERQLEALVNEAEDLDAAKVAVEERVTEWEETRAEKMASRESVQANGAISRLAYTVAGITTFVWVAIGQNCPLCDSLDGRTVGAQENFVNAGQEVAPEGAAPLTPRRGVAHPPLHQGCDCLVVAGG
jgi:HK97 family phage portal protein